MAEEIISKTRLEEMGEILREQKYGSTTADIFIILNEGKTEDEAEASFARIVRELAEEAAARRRKRK